MKLIILFLFGINVEQAYKAVPHRQTPYQAVESSQPPDNAKALAQLFQLTDQALIARIECMEWLKKREGEFASCDTSYTRVIDEIGKMPAPAELQEVKSSVGKAVKMQRQFFREQSKLPGPPEKLSKHRLVRRSSQFLRGAYDELMEKFSAAESTHNRQAYYDHISALDLM